MESIEITEATPKIKPSDVKNDLKRLWVIASSAMEIFKRILAIMFTDALFLRIFIKFFYSSA
jgi:hypothetical protein